MNEASRQTLRETRFTNPSAIGEAAANRVARSVSDDAKPMIIVAADHVARGALNVGNDPVAMGDRFDLLDRLVTALDVPGVDGVLGTPDIIEDLLLLGALDEKIVFGSMNRGGLPGATFEMDDRFTAYDVESIVASRLDGGKMLLRIDLGSVGTANTLEACARAVTGLAQSAKIAMVEPFMTSSVNGRAENDLTPNAVIRSMGIASALGTTSSHTWLKIPVVDEMERVAEAATTPLVLLGGPRHDHPDEMFDRFARALALPGVRGLVVGRNLLYPADGDVATAVKTAVSLR